MKIRQVVTALLIVSALAVWPARSALLGAQGQQLPPAGAQVAPQGRPTNPRVLREVKPVYTADAWRAKIEGAVIVECIVQADGTVGDVRVIKSLDSAYGLDAEAVKAAKQWRFVPGTKDGVAVPVTVAIELTFTLRSGTPIPAPLRWPTEFPSVADFPADCSPWPEEALEETTVRLRFAYPKGWRVRKDGPATQWLGVQSGGRGTRVVFLNRPLAATVPLSQPLTQSALDRIVNTIAQRLTAGASGARLRASGQVDAAGRIWLWYDMWVPANDPNFPPNAASRLEQVFDGATMWSFMTTVGQNGITLNCYVMHPRGASEADVREELRQAGAQFRTMIERMTIEVR